MVNDSDYMAMALELAKKGAGLANPNPMVGSVIVKAGRVIGAGYHEKYGGPHAERNALASVSEDPRGATMYVTLEPCCHSGKTPPCTKAVIESGVSRVVVGSRDLNPLVAGKGIEKLRERGIQVEEGVLGEECARLNEVFFHYIRTGTPLVTMKYAMTADGKIGTWSGKSRWITGEDARRQVHRDRNRFMAVMVGVGTVISDDPLLTCRLDGGRNPVRIVCDTNLRTPLDAKLLKTAEEAETYIATSCHDPARQKPYEEAGCRVIAVPEREGHLDLRRLMRELGSLRIDSVLLEGGAQLNAGALNAGIVDKVQIYIAPKLFGGTGAKGPVAGQGVEDPAKAIQLRDIRFSRLGRDILIEGRIERDEGAGDVLSAAGQNCG